MERRDSIRTGAGATTDWELLDVPTMWAFLQGQQTDNHWRHVAGWRKTYELTSEHLARLIAYRDNLAEAWPPAKSEAAALYIASLDNLISGVRQTYDAAVANYGTMAAVTGAIGTARSKLKKIYDEYAAKLREKQEFDARRPEQNKTSKYRATLPPPVTDADLEQLNRRARSIMYDLSATLVEATTQIKQPPAYKPGTGITGPERADTYGGSAPPIPPIVPIPLSTDTASDVLPRPAAPTAVATPQVGAGPILGGTVQETGSAPAMPALPSPPSTPAPGTGPIGAPGLAVTPALPTRVRTANGRSVFGHNTPSRPSAGGTPKVLPPGGLISGPSAAGPSRSATGPQPIRRVNPVGGMIGSQPANTASPPSQRRELGQQHRWKQDNPWETDRGVPPVVLPAPDPGSPDPGPAIGFNR